MGKPIWIRIIHQFMNENPGYTVGFTQTNLITDINITFGLFMCKGVTRRERTFTHMDILDREFDHQLQTYLQEGKYDIESLLRRGYNE